MFIKGFIFDAFQITQKLRMYPFHCILIGYQGWTRTRRLVGLISGELIKANLFFLFPKEISFDVFLQVIWEDYRIKPKTDQLGNKDYIELTTEERHSIWVPDLYIRQLREMKVLTLFEEISSLRLYENSTISLSIG